MKKMVKKLRLLLVTGMIIIPTIIMAQDPEEPDPFPTNVCDTCVPLDGGVSLLVAAGLAFGMKKVYDKKREEKDMEVLEK